MKNWTGQFSVLALAASVAVALSGCGGGGGGGGTTPMADGGGSMTGGGGGGGGGSTPPTQSLDELMAANAANSMRQAAGARPNPGSVTQSSNVNNGITTDRVEVTAEYGENQHRLEVRNGTSWSIGTSQIPDTDDPWWGAYLEQRIRGGTLYVDVYSDIDAPTVTTIDGTTKRLDEIPDGTPLTVSLDTLNARYGSGTLDGVSGTFHCDRASGGFCPVRYIVSGGVAGTSFDGTDWMFTPDTSTTTKSPDTDYLAGGIWLFVPDNRLSAGDYVFGVFGDGSDPFEQGNLAALTGAATYEGDAIGFYSEKTNGNTDIGEFEGDVMLTANFGSSSELGDISGSITDFVVDDVSHTGTLNLGTADIGSGNNGFFEGVVTGSDGDHSYGGMWGGQFFGNGESDGKPGSVGGTFGGSSEDDSVNFVGIFGAFKQ